MRPRTAYLIFTLTLATFALLFLYPLLMVIGGGFRDPNNPDHPFTLRYVAGVFQNPVFREGLLNSVGIALGTTTLVTLIAVPLAVLATRYDFRGKKLLSAMILVPMILPPFVGAIGFTQLLGQYGALNSFFHLGPIDWLGKSRYLGVIVLQALSLYPVMYLNASAALANIDPAMEQAAQNLGSGAWERFRRITLPLIMPGLFAGGTIVFIWSFTELGTPLIMNYQRCTPVQVFDALKEVGSNPFPYALVFVMLAVSVGLYALTKLVFGRNAYAMQAKASTQFAAVRLRGGRQLLVLLPFVVVTLVALLPHVAVVLTSVAAPGSWYQSALPQQYTGGNYAEALGHSMTVGSIRNSLLFSSLAVVFNVVLGVAIAYVVVRSTLRLRGLLDALAMLPLAVPGLVMAFGYLAISASLTRLSFDWPFAFSGKDSPAWKALVDVQTNPTLFLVIAYGVRRLPYMVRSAVAGLQQTSVTLEEASANLGATGWTTVRRVTMPLISANLLAGAMLAFAFSMLEVSDSLMLAQRMDYWPITKTIYELFQLIGTGKYVASALGVWAMVFLGVTILGVSLMLGRRLGAIFRV